MESFIMLAAFVSYLYANHKNTSIPLSDNDILENELERLHESLEGFSWDDSGPESNEFLVYQRILTQIEEINKKLLSR